MIKLKLPNVRTILNGLKSAFLRFPAAVVYCLGALVVICALIGAERFIGRELEQTLARFASIALLSAMFSTSITLFSESSAKTRKLDYLLQAVLFGLMTAYFFSFGKFEDEHLIRFAVLSFASIFVFFSASFVKNDSSAAFWSFNFSLIGRMIISFAFAAFIFIGFSVAVMAFSELIYKIHSDGKIIGYAAAFCFSFFAPVYWLAKIGKAEDYYIGEIKEVAGSVFLKFMTTPLVVVYLAILYIYLAKILVTGEVPKNWSATLILSFSAAGLINYVLMYPFAKMTDNPPVWARNYHKFFFFALLPLLPLLFYSIWVRIQTHGITEKRYIVAALGLWLFGISLYFLIGKRKSLRSITISLSLLAIASVFGPWNMVDVSIDAQFVRLMKKFETHGFIENGALKKSVKDLTGKEMNDLYSNLNFVADRERGRKLIAPMIPQELKDKFKNETAMRYELAKYLGVSYDYSVGSDASGERRFNFYSSRLGGKKLEPGKYMIHFSCYSSFYKRDKTKPRYESKTECKTEVDDLKLIFVANENKMFVYKGDVAIYEKDVFELAAKLAEGRELKNKDYDGTGAMVFSDETSKVKIFLMAESLNGWRQKEEIVGFDSLAGMTIVELRAH